MFDPVVSQLYKKPVAFGQPEEREINWTELELKSIDTLFVPDATTRTGGVPQTSIADLEDRFSRLRAPCVLSHSSAAILLGLELPFRIAHDQCLHLTVPRSRARPTQRGLHAHLGDLSDGETFLVGSLSITSPARIVADLAEKLTLPELNVLLDSALSWVDEADCDEFTPESFNEILFRRSRFPGRGRLRKLIALRARYLRARLAWTFAHSPWQSYLSALIADRYRTHVKVLALDQIVIPAHNVILVQPWHLDDDRITAMNIAATITALRSFGWCAFSLSYHDLLSEKSVLSTYEKARNHTNFNHLRELNQRN